MKGKVRYAAGAAVCLSVTLLTGEPFSWAAKAAQPTSFLVDDFDVGPPCNKLGGNNNEYVRAPSRAVAIRTADTFHWGNGCLKLMYDKKASGGPYNSGGWCGYYTLIAPKRRWFNATSYRAISFWVMGAKGDENFVVGVADHQWQDKGDSIKSKPIGKYLAEGRITKKWQKATIPLDDFFVNLQEVASIAICFEGYLFLGGAAKGTVYIDDLMLE